MSGRYKGRTRGYGHDRRLVRTGGRYIGCVRGRSQAVARLVLCARERPL